MVILNKKKKMIIKQYFDIKQPFTNDCIVKHVFD